jgi:glucose-1-phosphate cytidylyltransferase
MLNNQMEVHQRYAEPWKVTLVDTGEQTQTGGRLRQVRQYVKDEEMFCFTYGDGVGNIDITSQLKFHREHKKLATLTVVQQPGRFGSVKLKGGQITDFVEKPQGDGAWINGGYFVLSPEVIDYVTGPLTVWEKEPLQRLARDRQLMAWQHPDFWQPMDTLRDRNYLEDLWSKGKAPWKIWGGFEREI